MAEERIDIVITERGSRVVQRNLEDIGKSGRGAAGGVDFLKNALASLGAYLSARELVRLLDTYTNLQNRLRATGLEAQNLGAVYRSLLDVSNSTRQSLEGTVETYSRLANSAKDLGLSQQELIDFTKSLNQAIALSGASASEAQAGMIQLAQGLASGVLRGDELNSVLEQLPTVADVIAKQLNVTRGELRQMGQDGKISADIIFDAFKNARTELEERFATSVPTIGQSFQVLQNNVVDLVGKFDEATGASELLSRAIMFISDNLDTVAKVLLSLGAGFAIVAGGAAAFNAVSTAVVALNAAIAANPLGAFLIVLTSVITALTLFRDEIKLGIDDTTTLGDLMRAAWEDIGPIITGLANTVGEFFNWLTGSAATAYENMTDQAGASVQNQEAWWLKLVRTVLQVFDMIGGTIRGVMRGVLNVVGSVIDALMNNFRQLGNALKAAVDLDVDGLKAAVTSNIEGWKAVGANIGTNFEEGFRQEVLAQSESGLEAMLDSWIERARDISKERVAAAQVETPDLGGGGGRRTSGKGDEEAAKALKKLQDELNQLVGSYDRVWAAQQEYANALALLDKAERAGLITAERKAQVLALIEEQLKDSLDPMGAINRQLEEERELLRLTSEQREVEQQLRYIEQDLRYQGIILGEQELKQLREKLTLIQAETRAAETRNQVLQAILGPQKEFTAQLTAINELLAAGAITQAQANQFLVESNADLLAGTVEAQQAMLSQYEQMYARIDEMRQADLISEQTAQQLKARVQAQITEQNLSTQRNFFSTLSGLSRSENKKLAAIGKAAAITTATIDGVLAVQKALASAPPPANYALAAATGAVAAANVAQIIAQTPGFAFGGDFTVGGTGGTDSQLVAFRATPGEQVSIRTPTQERDEARQGGGEGQQGGGSAIRVVNVIDPNLMQDYLTSSSGERVLLNVIQRNAGAVRQVVNNG
ncbi:tail length tape measure protein [Pseudomonas phage PC1]